MGAPPPLLRILPLVASLLVVLRADYLSEAPIASADSGEEEADRAGSRSESVFKGRRLLQVGNFLLFDFADGRKQPQESVDGQLCEYASSREVTVDLLMVGYTLSQIEYNEPAKVMYPCLGRVFVCPTPSAMEMDEAASLEPGSPALTEILDCMAGKLSVPPGGGDDASSAASPAAGVLRGAGRDATDARDPTVPSFYDAIYTRDDDRVLVAGGLALHYGVAPLFAPGVAGLLPVHADLTTSAQSSLLISDGGGKVALPDDCQLTEADAEKLSFPGFIKYAKGVHATGGWGSTCLRQMSTVRSAGELMRKLPFFCGEGMYSYEFLQTADQRRKYLVPHRFGLEVNAEVVVHHGRVVEAIFQSGLHNCDDRYLHTFPAYWPGFPASEHAGGSGGGGTSAADSGEAKCNAVIEKAARAVRAHNMILGIQMVYDWRDGGSCHFIETNVRPHDWMMLSNPGFGARHFERPFDYGAVALHLAFGLDPRPVLKRAPRSARMAMATVCPTNITGAGGFMNHHDITRSWYGGKCHGAALRSTPAAAFAAVQEHLTCLDGPKVEDVTPALKRICVADITEEWFWWSDAAALEKDINALAHKHGDGAKH